ncbi:MAG: hypothetical protein DRH51_01575 [Candidatus Coatesbacteria bacterium]|nr:MAG: hypothetical protein DRH49_05820 [Candidatus Coatesbacteria bacterium]RLC42076.1 MAG: hypothetical protein DRH51_01575 [Candidatus Coatesbacteria bacterium]RLC44275.1 MAG: hypothetical protein DRH44_02865 [Candidatus Coatesbacteria bacterium]
MPEEEEKEEIDPIEAIRRRNLDRARRLKESLKFGDFGLGGEKEEEETAPDEVIDQMMGEEAPAEAPIKEAPEEVPPPPVDEEITAEGREEFEELDLSSFAPSVWEEEETPPPPPDIEAPEEVGVAEPETGFPQPEIGAPPTEEEEEIRVQEEREEVLEEAREPEIAEPPVPEPPVEEKVEEPAVEEPPIAEEPLRESIQVIIEVLGNRVRIGRKNIKLDDTIELLENIIRRYKEMEK